MEAIQPNPTETLDHQPPPSYADPSPPPPLPTTQTLPENPTENGNGGSSSDAAVRAAVTHLTNGLTTSATERDASGGEEETTSRRRRRSRWDPQPESENAGEDSGKRKRKSRWADEEPKPVVQLPEFMGGIEFDPEIQASNSRLLEISRILYSGLPLGKRKRKSRWADEEPKPVVQLPEFMGGVEFDPEIQALNSRLLEISRILYSGLPLDDRPEGARSRVYDNMRIRINTREFRARERLNRERQEIIAQILKRNPNFKPPETWDYSSDSFC